MKIATPVLFQKMSPTFLAWCVSVAAVIFKCKCISSKREREVCQLSYLSNLDQNISIDMHLQ
jgi:hypothetical protein